MLRSLISPRVITGGHGDVFASDAGAMIVHVQREVGLAHQTLVFRPWHVRILRYLAGRRGWIMVGLLIVSWFFFAVEAVRVPMLVRRLDAAQLDARRLDTLETALRSLQSRYDQVQDLLRQPSQPVRPAPSDARPARP